MDLEKLKQDIEAYKQSEQEASEIIAELKHTLDCKNGTIETLKAENERLKEEKGGMQILIDNYITLTEKYHQTLQEIKAIAEVTKPFIDFSETKTATEVGYDYAVICNELELRLHKVVELITKAEEE